MSSVFGYLKSDINETNVKLQRDQLQAAGASKIYQEECCPSKHNRPQLDELMAELQGGDTLLVTSLESIAYTTKHLLEIVESLNAAGVTFKVINIDIDTSAPYGEIIRTLLAAIVDFEWKVIKERQSIGIAKAKREGRYKGRKPTARAKTNEVLTLAEKGLTRKKIADEIGIGVASVYRILKSQKVPHKPSINNVKKPEKIIVNKQKPVKLKSSSQNNTKQLTLF